MSLELETLRAENARMAEALILSVKAMQIVSDWDSSFPEGLEIDDQWIRPHEILKKIQQSLAQSPKSQALVEVERTRSEVIEDAFKFQRWTEQGANSAYHNLFLSLNKLDSLVAEAKRKAGGE